MCLRQIFLIQNDGFQKSEPCSLIPRIRGISGADDQDRTGDLILTMDVLYQLSYIGLGDFLRASIILRNAALKNHKSGRRDSNPRPTAWKAVALPTELLPRCIRQSSAQAESNLRAFLFIASFRQKLRPALWARMDSNHRTPKRTDLQSVAVGHLATCPPEPLVGIEPTTY